MKQTELIQKLETMPDCLFTKQQVIEMMKSIQPEVLLTDMLPIDDIKSMVKDDLLASKTESYIDYDQMDLTFDHERKVCVMGVNWLKLDYILDSVFDVLKEVRENNDDLIQEEKPLDDSYHKKPTQEEIIESLSTSVSKGISEEEILECPSPDDVSVSEERVENAMPDFEFKGVRIEDEDDRLALRDPNHIFPYDPDVINTK